MTDEHKAALDRGRREARAVKAYLEGLEATKPKRGRRRTADTIAARLEKIEAELADATPMSRLALVQERLDLQAELAAMEQTVDLEALEQGFIECAAGYGERKGITYTAWREVGVDPKVLEAAGIARTRR